MVVPLARLGLAGYAWSAVRSIYHVMCAGSLVHTATRPRPRHAPTSALPAATNRRPRPTRTGRRAARGVFLVSYPAQESAIVRVDRCERDVRVPRAAAGAELSFCLLPVAAAGQQHMLMLLYGRSGWPGLEPSPAAAQPVPTARCSCN
jgi:hypothetical protein